MHLGEADIIFKRATQFDAHTKGTKEGLEIFFSFFFSRQCTETISFRQLPYLFRKCLASIFRREVLIMQNFADKYIRCLRQKRKQKGNPFDRGIIRYCKQRNKKKKQCKQHIAECSLSKSNLTRSSLLIFSANNYIGEIVNTNSRWY